MTDRRKTLLAVMASGAGSHIAAWRHPDANAAAGISIADHVEMAQASSVSGLPCETYCDCE